MVNMLLSVINGPNLNLLGTREPHIYGSQTLTDIENRLREKAADAGIELVFMQSNSEGEVVDAIQQAGFDSHAGIIINAAALTHTSVAIHDAIKGVSVPAIEVHLSNPHSREEFRHKSFLSSVCKGVICGFGEFSYQLALEYFIREKELTE